MLKINTKKKNVKLFIKSHLNLIKNYFPTTSNLKGEPLQAETLFEELTIYKNFCNDLKDENLRLRTTNIKIEVKKYISIQFNFSTINIFLIKSKKLKTMKKLFRI